MNRRGNVSIAIVVPTGARLKVGVGPANAGTHNPRPW